ncbi:MAG TPA: hypothetical protein VLT86_17885 [Vicinamibacterales bacterium]|nr:hypothetical protein [Vicinamibacterales bacterium]
MEPLEVLQHTQENISARRVFGEPFQADGATILPVAVVGGGGGAGNKTDKEGGVGFGLGARPAGVYVIKNGEAKWRPALNVNLIIAGGQIVALAGMLALRSWLKHRHPKEA